MGDKYIIYISVHIYYTYIEKKRKVTSSAAPPGRRWGGVPVLLERLLILEVRSVIRGTSPDTSTWTDPGMEQYWNARNG
jgi:hypothetical protein